MIWLWCASMAQFRTVNPIEHSIQTGIAAMKFATA